MFIETEPTSNPDRIKFRPGRAVLSAGLAGFVDAAGAKRSPLAQRLFELPGVVEVYLDAQSVSVKKSESIDWPIVKTMVMGTIMEHFSSGEPIIHDEDQPLPAPGLDTKEGEVIQRFIQQNVNPQIASHGGSITLIEVHDDTVYVRMEGGCQGCSMANVTLKQGVATQIQTLVPKINTVLDVTDHASGTNPYQGPAGDAQSPFHQAKK